MNDKITINKEDGSVTVIFDTRFYPSDCVFKASQDFSDVCFTSVDGQDIMQVLLKPKTEEIDLYILGHEFYNYVLGIIKNDGKVPEIVKGFR
ncbi:MAG: hypothetical protein V1900_02665 [Candidatus Aenigmatarchaeota archaeon]